MSMVRVQPQATEHPDDDEPPGGYELTLAEFSRTLLWMLLLVVIAIGFNGVSLAGEFLDRDGPRVTENLALRTWGGIKPIWRLPHQFPDFSPLTYTVYLLEARMWGSTGERAAAGFRLVNLIVHAAAVVLLFHLLRRLDVPGAFVASAVFAVHPANVSSVAWVAQRPALLGSLLGLLALTVLLRVIGVNPQPLDRHRLLRLPDTTLWLSLLAGLLVILTLATSPAISAALGPIVLTLAWWKRGRIERDVWIATTPLLALSLAILVGAGVLASRATPPWAAMLLDGVSLWQRPTAFLMQLLGGLMLTVAPFRLRFAYPPFDLNWMNGLAVWAVIGAIVTAAVVLARRRRRGLAAAAIAFTALALPGALWVRQAELYGGWIGPHLLYPATAAVLVPIVAVVAGWMPRRNPLDDPLHDDRRGWFAPAAGAGVILVLGGFAVERAYTYQSQPRLWTDTLDKAPDFVPAMLRSGATAMQRGDLFEAERLFLAAARAEPGSAVPLTMLGELYERRGHTEPRHRARARDLFTAALARDRDHFEAISGMARVLHASGDTAGALRHYERARQLRPRDPMILNNIGLVHVDRGEYQQAESIYRRALEIDPRATSVRINLANLLYQMGRFEAAANELVRAVEIDPRSWEAFMNAGAMLGQMKQFDKAVTLFRQAVSLNKDSAEAYSNLGMALIGRAGEASVSASERRAMLGEAGFCFERAAALNPRNPLYPQMLQEVRRLRESTGVSR